MPRPFTGPKMFCAGPNFLSQSQNLIAFSAGTKINFTECKSSFCLATICKKKIGLAQKIGPAQNILEPIKGQGISSLSLTP